MEGSQVPEEKPFSGIASGSGGSEHSLDHSWGSNWAGAACPEREATAGLDQDSVEYGPVSRADDPSFDLKWRLKAFFSANQVGQVAIFNGN